MFELSPTQILLIAAPLGMLFGAAAWRGRICTVKAVKELVEGHRPLRLMALLEGLVYASLIVLILEQVVGARPGPGWMSWSLSPIALVGGFVFGVGATLSQGCAIALIGRVGSGDLRGLLILVGVIMGVGLSALVMTDPQGNGGVLSPTAQWILVLSLLALAVVARLLDARRVRAGCQVLEPQDGSWRASRVGAALGFSDGALLVLVGDWLYVSTGVLAVRWALGEGPAPSLIRWVMLVAVLLGVFLAARTEGRFKLRWRPQHQAPMLVGGALMGFGAALVPGGNDGLMFEAVPGGATYGLPVLLCLLAGVGLALTVKKRLSA